jgi:hypothetical protein
MGENPDNVFTRYCLTFVPLERFWVGASDGDGCYSCGTGANTGESQTISAKLSDKQITTGPRIYPL